MFPAETFQVTLAKLTAALDRLAIRFHLTGGVTTIAYGEPRMTQDVDLVIDPLATVRQIEPLLVELRAAGFLVDDETARRAVRDAGMFQALDLAESLKIDLYPRELIPGELGRSVRLEVFEGVFLPVASRPDAAASKLVWVSKGSHKSRRDLRQLWRRATPDERSLVERLAHGLDLEAILIEVLAEPDEIAP
jgi:hypothetical protein